MRITTEQQYQDAVTELTLLADAPFDDEAAQRRKRALEADVEQYEQQLKQSGERVGRPDPYRAT